MTAVITTDIFCDRCSDWIGGTTGPSVQIRKSRASARADGWEYRPYVGDVCPQCATESRTEQFEARGEDEDN